MNTAAILNIDNVSKFFSAHSTAAVKEVSLSLQEGELLGLLGPSGCGKTTLVRIIAGFEQPSSGTIELAGKVVNCSSCWIPPEQRNTGMVFQDYASFPHLSIAENIAFGLKKQLTRDRLQKRVAEVLELVALKGLEKRYPHQLSGGQQQRVALARAIAPQPSLILLDEPLSNLDVQVRQRLREEIRSILKAAGTTAIFVTHDREEALAISDKIGVMCQGKLEQIGTPEEIYSKPASRFVAEFVTQANFVTARRKGNFWHTEIAGLEIAVRPTPDYLDKGELMLPQEDISIEPDERSTTIVRDRQFLGREYRYCLETASGKRLHARTATNSNVRVGERVKLSVALSAPQIFPV
ncbi:MAG: ABC transporter ATP-binding protein [Xenococcaceae cyanobacterium]